jgi:hypothetical protein
VWLRARIGISVEIVFHSDKMNFLFPFNAGTRQDLSEWPLILLNFQLTLNQRVTGSSPVAPTTQSPASLKTAVSDQKAANCGGLCDFRLVFAPPRTAHLRFSPSRLWAPKFRFP